MIQKHQINHHYKIILDIFQIYVKILIEKEKRRNNMNLDLLKVRAKNKDTGEWVKGFYMYSPKVDGLFDEKHCIITYPRERYYLEYIEINPKTICRHWFENFYENDIIQFPRSRMIIKYGDISIYSLTCMMNFRYYGFYLQSIDFTDDLITIEDIEYFLNNYKKLKKIGNKFDNPKLLKGDNNENN